MTKTLLTKELSLHNMLTRLPTLIFFSLIYFCSSLFLIAGDQQDIRDNQLTIIKMKKSPLGRSLNVYTFLELLNVNYYQETKKESRLCSIITSGNPDASLVHPCTEDQFKWLNENTSNRLQNSKPSDVYDVTATIRKHVSNGSKAIAFFDNKHTTFYLFSSYETQQIYLTHAQDKLVKPSPLCNQTQLSIFSVTNTQENLKMQPSEFKPEQRTYHLTSYLYSSMHHTNLSQKISSPNLKFESHCELSIYSSSSYNFGGKTNKSIYGTLDFTFKNDDFSIHYLADMITLENEITCLNLGISDDKKSLYLLELRNRIESSYSCETIESNFGETIPDFIPQKPKSKKITLTLTEDQIELIESITNTMSTEVESQYDLTELCSKQIHGLDSVYYLKDSQSLLVVTSELLADAIQQLRDSNKPVSITASYTFHQSPNPSIKPETLVKIKDTNARSIEIDQVKKTPTNTEDVKYFSSKDETKANISITQKTLVPYSSYENILAEVDLSYNNERVAILIENITTTLPNKGKTLPICTIEGVNYMLEIEPHIETK